MQKKTKIVATIGPSSQDSQTLAKLHAAGVDVIRMNFSHGDHEEHGGKVTRWREIMEESSRGGAVLADLAGPEIRTGDIANPRSFSEGDKIRLTASEGDSEAIYVNYSKLTEDVSAGDTVLIDDGKIVFSVDEVSENEVIGSVTQGGEIAKGGRGVNIPGVELQLPALTEKDIADVEFAVEQEADFVAISFVKTADDVKLLREKLAELDAEHTKIIAKIETQAAVDNIDAIIAASDGIMVARGDLAVEVSFENVPVIQKDIIRKCNRAGVPVITATQMLESMTHAASPTRAEASDVANAIFDGSDAVMLSGETALGEHPVAAVSTMTQIAQRVESVREAAELKLKAASGTDQASVDAVTGSVVRTAEEIEAKAVVAFTDSGFTARMVSRHRPHQPVLAFSPYDL